MMEWVEPVAILVTAFVAFTGMLLSIKSRKTNTSKVESETNLNEAQQAEIVRRISESSEEKFQRRIAKLEREIESLKLYINRHIPWDWKAVRELRLAGIDIEDPPSLQYIQNGSEQQ